MTCGDITRWGGLPLVSLNVLDVATLGEAGTPTNDGFRSFIDGLEAAAKEGKVVVMGGETAGLGVFVGSEDPDAYMKYNCAGFAIGVCTPDRMITGKDMRPGQKVVALKEDGARSNGISLFRKTLALQFGSKWSESPDAQEAIAQLSVPSKLYDVFLAEANGWGQTPRIPVTAIAHISGGGIPSKFGEDLLFRAGLSARLDELFVPPPIMQQCKDWRNEAFERGELKKPFLDKELYQVWNGGQGALVVLEEEYVDVFLALAQTFGIEAQVCGEILPSDGSVRLEIVSKFTGETLVY
jgi:phosphoribosylformylglycinamidine cyclo-ligase